VRQDRARISLADVDEPAEAAERADSVIPAERISSYWGALRRYWWIILLTTALAVGGAVASVQTVTKQYDATAKVLLTGVEPTDVLTKSNSRSLDPQRDFNTATELVKASGVTRAVRSQLGLPISLAQLAGEVTAAAQGNSNILAITARDRFPARAAAIANAFGKQYVRSRQLSARQLYLTAAASGQARLDALTPSERAEPGGRELRARVQQLVLASDVQTGGSQLVELATMPTSAATPRPKQTIAIAIVVGLFVGGMLALALDLRRRH
jgi:uncharacterized protein involved in exopolysaccharide biosynthesis